jgi:hypothetical protein
MAHRAYPLQPKDYIRRKADKALSDGVEDSVIKIRLQLGRERGERSSQASLRSADLAPSSQAQGNQRQDIFRSRSPQTRLRD